MNIHWFQHVPFEGLGCIEPWLAENGHTVTCTRLWAGDSVPIIGKKQQALTPSVPNSGTVDGLIVMGGPMGITDEADYPWLAAEKEFIKEVIAQDKPVLGICLGAQLIADVLGAEVRSGKNKEIGFFECRASVPLAFLQLADPLDAENDPEGCSVLFPRKFMAFHWHGDTFDIPDGAMRLVSSEATENQAFLCKNNVLALQFHLETTEQSLLTLYSNGSGKITDGPFIQTVEEATALRLANGDPLKTCNDLMRQLLERLFYLESRLTNNE